MLVLAAAAACKLSPDLAQDVAIEVTTPDSLEEFAVLKPQASILTARGGFDTTIPVFWFSPDTAIRVTDSTTGWTVVRVPGATGRLFARGDGLLSNPVTIRTLAAADTLFAAGPIRDSVSASSALSDSLKVELADTVPSSTGADSLTVPLAGRPVLYRITHPAPGPVTLETTPDTARALDTLALAVTGGAGIASVKVRLLAAAPPDSVVVVASASRASGSPVHGVVIFTVRFLP
ncbi:MAG TPA: hypothetical protein VM736_01200 [Gemmatimonadales bacterium]|nr:hypothetical protein [Gemmatimonadales bacterium]